MIGFRVANEASTTRHVATTLLQTAVFWATFLWLFPELLAGLGNHFWLPRLGVERAGGQGFAVALFVAASALGLGTGLTMAVRGRGTPLPLCTAREFVTSGPYRWLRNPMALAGIIQGIAVGLWRDEPLVVLYALAGAVLWHLVARPPEERDLARRFGPPFAAYRDRVGLWLPRLPRIPELGLAVLFAAGAVVLVADGSGSLAALFAVSPFALFAALLAALLGSRSLRPPRPHMQ
ncbi:MAG: isoprenylcysteine carboxylmethyltransferase family protein [Planctomycetota bacterium]